jgi:D-alanyl-D-alanine carboxypeptidase
VRHMAVVAVLGGACQQDPPGDEGLPEAELQEIAQDLVSHAGAPGVVLGVQLGEQRWLGAAGSQDLEGSEPMPVDGVLRAGSLTKMYVGALVLRAVERGELSLSDPLSDWVPDFPEAERITVEQLLSHTGGLTTRWFDEPELQAIVTADLQRQWQPLEVIELMSAEEPAGPPGESGMLYSNTGYVLLGHVLEELAGQPLAEQMQQELFDPLGLQQTYFTSDDGPGLVTGHFEYLGLVLSSPEVPQRALVSFAGAAGAMQASAGDLMDYLGALLREQVVVSPDSVARMQTLAEPDSWYGHALMHFETGSSEGWGHGGHLPGYWVVAVYYPERDIAVLAMINRDSVDGVALDRDVFDPTLAAVLERL